MGKKKFKKCNITLEFTKETLADLLSLNQRMITIDQIQKITANYYKTRVGDILSSKRDKKINKLKKEDAQVAQDYINIVHILNNG